MVEKFSRSANGYDVEQVNKFVDDVIVQTEAVINRVRSQQDEIKNLKKEIPISYDRIFRAIISPESYNLYDKYQTKKD